MTPKHWWITVIIFLLALPWLWIAFDTGKYDPESLPPPAAGTSVITPQARLSCEGIIYSLSADGIRYVREAGGGTLLAAALDNEIAFYRLGRYGDPVLVADADMNSEAAEKLEFALTNCDASHTPSGVNFASR